MDPLKTSIRIVKPKQSEYQLFSDATYDTHTFHKKLRTLISYLHLNDDKAQYTIHEVVLLILDPNFALTYNLEKKMGIMLLYHGFPVLSMESIHSHMYSEILVIDIDNYIFNKTIEQEIITISKTEENEFYNGIGIMLLVGCVGAVVLYSIFK